jgi:uncharacterized membrane protein SirB2
MVYLAAWFGNMNIKDLHISFAILTFISFSLRGMWMLTGSGLLKHRLVRILPHAVDTCLFASGLAMALLYFDAFYEQAWLVAKLLALVLYIMTGSMALKYGKSKNIRVSALIVSWLIFIYIVMVARTKTPIPYI